MQTFEENMSKVTNYCSDEKNFKVPVMKAVEQVLGGRKSQPALPIRMGKNPAAPAVKREAEERSAGGECCT